MELGLVFWIITFKMGKLWARKIKLREMYVRYKRMNEEFLQIKFPAQPNRRQDLQKLSVLIWEIEEVNNVQGHNLVETRWTPFYVNFDIFNVYKYFKTRNKHLIKAAYHH